MKLAVTLSLSFLLAAALVAGPAGARKDTLQDLVLDFQLVPLDGQPAPPFTLASLDGTTVSLAKIRGRPVLLYFWHST